MKKKKLAMIAILILCAFTLSACQSAFFDDSGHQKGQPVALPKVSLPYEAPIGNVRLNQTTTVAFYLPNKDRSKLVAINQEVSLPVNRHGAEAVLRALLAHPGNETTVPLSPHTALALSDYFPVEISRDVATVNLTQSALELSSNELFIVSQAITNTLSAFTDISYVNILVMGKQIGLDTVNTLPMGTLQEQIGFNLVTQWEQIESRKVSGNEPLSKKRLSLPVTLYFPVESLGIIPEVRNTTFPGQEASQLILILLEELSKGSNFLENSPKMPDLANFLLEEPVIEALKSTSGQKIILRFSDALYKEIIDTNNQFSSIIASLNYTLTTFIPNISGLELYIGDKSTEPLLTLTPQSPYISVAEISFPEGLQRRSDFTSFLMGYATLYFPEQAKQGEASSLVRVMRPIPYYETKDPSYLLTQLISGPQYYDSRKDTQPFFSLPIEFSMAYIRGVSYENRTLLIHFASNFFDQLPQALSPQMEGLFVYSMVNTLCENPSIDGICFYVDALQPETFVGSLYLPGTFYPNFGLINE